MKRIVCFFLALLLLGALAGCVAMPAERESDYNIPIVTQGSKATEAPPAETPRGEDRSSTEAPSTDQNPETPTEQAPDTEAPAPETEPGLRVTEDGVYDSRDEVALYIHLYRHLPSNYITKKEAEKLGWPGGSLEPYAPGKCIGGSHFGNYEGLLPDAKGRSWTECDIDTLGARSRGAKRIIFSNDGLIYYTDDHYESFTQLYDGWED